MPSNATCITRRSPEYTFVPWTLFERARMSTTTPMSSNTSIVRACTTAAFEYTTGSSSCSTIRHVTPCRRSSAASVRPVGPAPTTRTSVVTWLAWDMANIKLLAAPERQGLVERGRVRRSSEVVLPPLEPGSAHRATLVGYELEQRFSVAEPV